MSTTWTCYVSANALTCSAPAEVLRVVLQLQLPTVAARAVQDDVHATVCARSPARQCKSAVEMSPLVGIAGVCMNKTIGCHEPQESPRITTAAAQTQHPPDI
jgi:hypothetical protein